MSKPYDVQKILEMAESMGISFPDDFKEYIKSSDKLLDKKAEFTLDVIKNAAKTFQRPTDQGQVIYAIPAMFTAYTISNGMEDDSVSLLTRTMSAMAALSMAFEGIEKMVEAFKRETDNMLRKISADHPEVVEEMKKVHERIAKEKSESEKSKNEAIK